MSLTHMLVYETFTAATHQLLQSCVMKIKPRGVPLMLFAANSSICLNNELTQLSVVEREVSEVCRVLRQSEKTSRQAIPHQVTPRGVPQHPVLDDLQK